MRLNEIDNELDYSKKLFEMPFLIAGKVTWGLEKTDKNKRQKNAILKKNPTVVEANNNGILYSVPNSKGGYFCFISKITGEIEYFMQYKDEILPILKSSATQIMVWNRSSPTGTTTKVFFDYMLKEFNTMVSDDSQTVDGQRFWQRQLIEGIGRGFNIGMLDGSTMKNYDTITDYNTWLQSVDGWGTTDAHWDRRFFVTKENLNGK
jgi:hypothetical protein